MADPKARSDHLATLTDLRDAAVMVFNRVNAGERVAPRIMDGLRRAIERATAAIEEANST